MSEEVGVVTYRGREIFEFKASLVYRWNSLTGLER